MDLFSMFKGGKYFDKHIEPKCDYCQFGRRAKDGNKVLCEKRGIVECSFSCNKFIYSPLKRIPVKQLNFVGSLADEDIYIESAGDRAEKEEMENPKKAAKKEKAPEKKEAVETKNAPAEKTETEEAVEESVTENAAPVEAVPEEDAPDAKDDSKEEVNIPYEEYVPPKNN